MTSNPASTAPQRGRLPNFLIVGAPKAGTTSLAAYLAEHPDVFMSAEKELHYFDRNFERGLEWYRSWFENAGAERALGEASPTYMHRDLTLERMRDLLPEARLIAILRHPVDRAYSHYWWMRAMFESRPFEETVREEIADPEAYPLGRRYLEPSRYLERLKRVCDFYPREALHVVVLENLRADPTAVFAGVCRHLSVDDRFAPQKLGSVVNPAYRLRFPRLREAMLRRRAWKRLPGGLADAIDRWNRVRLEYPPMDGAVRARLLEYFAPGNAALAEWLDTDLSAWER